jgi:multicomponent Na+:H+ antiporter subunit G
VTVVVDVVSAALLVVGTVFLFGGTVGLARLPDLYTRAHAASKCDSAGAGSILLALLLHGGLAFGDLKLVALMLLVLVSGPTTAHALARAGFRTGLAPWADRERGRS